VHVQRWHAREQQHQDLARRLLRALSLVKPYVPVASWNTMSSDFGRWGQVSESGEPQSEVSESGEPQSEPQREPQRGGHVSEPCESQSHVSEPCEPQRGGRSVEPPVVALAVLPGALPAAAAAGLSERATASAAVATAEEPAAGQLPVRPSPVPRHYVQDWSTGEWMPWRLLQQRLAARRELQGGREQRPRGTRVRGCRAGRRGRSRRSDANCVGVSCEYALSSEEREAECQVIAAMRSVA
jgi:hypothetical protein